jgi:hypothetical protein
VPSRGKAKGNSWEREVAGFLKDVFNLPFQRVPNSGAFLGGSNASRRMGLDEKQSRIMTGDLIVPEELNHCSFECKFYKTFDYHLLFQQNKQLESWIDQARDGCNPDQIWFLCIKSNRREPIVAMQGPLFFEFVTQSNFVRYKYKNDSIYLTDMKSFFPRAKNAILNTTNTSVLSIYA